MEITIRKKLSKCLYGRHGTQRRCFKLEKNGDQLLLLFSVIIIFSVKVLLFTCSSLGFKYLTKGLFLKWNFFLRSLKSTSSWWLLFKNKVKKHTRLYSIFLKISFPNLSAQKHYGSYSLTMKFHQHFSWFFACFMMFNLQGYPQDQFR